MQIAIWSIVLTVSIAALVKGSDFFIDSAEEIGIFFNLPHFVIGVIIVGIGTSLPELVSSIFSVVYDSSEIVIGNVLGSNITNTFLVLGFAALLAKSFHINYDLMKLDVPFLFASAAAIAIMILDKDFTLGEAIICLVLLLIYLIASIMTDKTEDDFEKVKPKILSWILLFVGPIMIYFGAKYTVESVINLSKLLNIATETIALSAVALGTSLPELLVTISAARRGKAEIAVGNVVGSNTFNCLAVMGGARLAGPLLIRDSILVFSLPLSIMATFLIIFMTMNKKMNRWLGFLLLAGYAYFILNLFKIM